MWDALPAPLRRARGGRPTTTAHFLAPKRTCLRLPRSTAAVDVLAEFGIEPPSVLRMRALLALRLRYAALSAGLGTSTLASRLFVGDGALPSRTRTSTPVAAECEHLCRTVGEKQDGATLWWHRQCSMRLVN